MFCKRLLIINLLCVFLGVLQVNALDLPERIVQSLEAGNAKNMDGKSYYIVDEDKMEELIVNTFYTKI